MNGVFSPLWALPALLGCYVAFAWAIRSHFSRPQGMPPRMRLLAAAGGIGGGLHVGFTAFAPAVHWLVLAAALLLYALSAGLFAWAVSATREQRLSIAYSNDEPTALLQSGPYARIRHPFYTAYILFWFAGAVLNQSALLTGFAIAITYLYFEAARLEEAKFASSQLAQAYRAYQSKSGLFWPK